MPSNHRSLATFAAEDFQESWSAGGRVHMSSPSLFLFREGSAAVDDAADGACLCPGCAMRSPSEPQFFIAPTSGTAGNGLPIYNWDQAAAQLTRQSNGWAGLGNPANVTFAFRESMVGPMPSGTSGFQVFTEAQIVMTLEALALWSEVANITFTRIQDGDPYSNNATMLFANYTAGLEGASAFAYYPGSTSATASPGDVWVNFSLDTNNSDLVEGAFGPHTISHEIGHAIGLAHPADYDSLSGVDPAYPESSVYWQDSRMYTVMSYFGSAGPGGSLGAFASGPQLHDIAAAQLLYGANMTTRTGDTVYGFHSNTGHAHFTITADEQTPVFAIWDAGGNDTIDLSGYSTAVEIDLREEAFSSAGPGTNPAIANGRAYGNISIARGAVIENGIGGAGGDLLIGNAVSNSLIGNDGNDTLNGNAGNDILDGGIGADNMSGGTDDDTYLVDNGGDVVTENASEGTDTIRSTVGVAALAANVENLVLLATAVTGNGNGLNNIITGNSSNNFINGLAGADTMIGGLGNDTYFIDNVGDVVTELSGEGTDTIFSTITIAALAQQVENLTLSGTALNANGNFLNNIITGNAQKNTLNGGAGEDTLIGGLDSDTYIYNSLGDVITENLNEGLNDAVTAFIDVTALMANVENVTLAGTAISATGNDLNNIITGNSLNNFLYGGIGNDQLNGAVGADTMTGGQGDDTYLVENLGDVVIEASGEGNDVIYTWVNIAALTDNVERATIIGPGNLNITGNSLNNRLNGNDNNNVLSGVDGEDIIGGLAGNDTIIGGAGRDLLTGGAGADTFVYQAITDSGATGSTRDIIYDFAQGQDLIDLVAIDAINGGGDDAFNFIGNAAFSNTAGELRYEVSGGYTIISMDINGDGIADSQITLVGNVPLTSADFGL